MLASCLVGAASDTMNHLNVEPLQHLTTLFVETRDAMIAAGYLRLDDTPDTDPKE